VVNTYLFLAYAFVWMIFMLYAWNLSRRNARLRRDLEDLKRRMPGQPASTRSSS
jgi:CcmD family protein